MLDTQAPRYIVVDEEGPGCEWEFYIVANDEHCPNDFTKAIVDTYEDLDDARDLHIEHLCDEHIGRAFAGMNVIQDWR